VQQVDFPIVATSEIEGFVIRRGAELSRPMGAIRVQLINEREQIEREVRTSGDGYFVIGEVRPGRYRVRPDPEQLAKLGFVVQREIEIATTQQGGELHVVELIVTRSAGT
jgi:anti-sigma regulatory factor (Ser/Thr protein kinase)